jgi:hypothetical protein
MNYRQVSNATEVKVILVSKESISTIFLTVSKVPNPRTVYSYHQIQDDPKKMSNDSNADKVVQYKD